MSTEHLPRRPLWTCQVCGKDWPCDPARERLATEYVHDRVALVVLMVTYFEDYAFEVGVGPLNEAYERFIGWARRGPTGTIGTNRPDGFMIAEHIAADIPANASKPGRAALDALFAARGVDVVTFRDWQRIDEAEVAHARTGSPREKFTAVDAMLAARSPL